MTDLPPTLSVEQPTEPPVTPAETYVKRRRGSKTKKDGSQTDPGTRNRDAKFSREPSSSQIKESMLNYKIAKLQANNGWNLMTEKAVKGFGEKAASYKWMHDRSAGYYGQFAMWWGIFNTAVLLGVGTSVFSSIAYCNTVWWVQIITGLVTYLVTFSVNISNFLDFQGCSKEHKRAGSEWSELYHNIQRQLVLNRRDRQYAKDYLMWITKEFDSLYNRSPDIPDTISNKFTKSFQGITIEKPDTVGIFGELEVNTDINHSGSSDCVPDSYQHPPTPTNQPEDPSNQPVDYIPPTQQQTSTQPPTQQTPTQPQQPPTERRRSATSRDISSTTQTTKSQSSKSLPGKGLKPLRVNVGSDVDDVSDDSDTPHYYRNKYNDKRIQYETERFNRNNAE